MEDILSIKLYLCLFLLLLLSCNENKTSASYTYIGKNNLDSLLCYDMYQTFDEYSMCGIGDAIQTPFVYVKKSNDLIFVKISNCLDSTIIYRYDKKNDFWYNERYLDWNKHEYSKNDIYGPRKYSRYIFNDTIIEIKESFSIDDYNNRKKESNTQFFVKTRKGCLQIQYLREVVNISKDNMFSDIKRIIKTYNKRTNLMNVDRYVSIFGGDGYLLFNKEIRGDSLIFSSETQKEIFFCKYPLNSLGEFGCGAGLEIKSDDLTSYEIIKTGTAETKDNAYRETSVDKKAQFVKGQENLEKYIHANLIIPSNAVLHGERETVILNLKIDASGNVIGHEIPLSRGEVLDNAAIDFCYKRLNFNPAIKDGKKVASWLVVPIKFYKD